MKLVEIYSGLIWSVCYESTKKNVFSKLFDQWMDLEYLTTFITKNERFIKENPFFSGYSTKGVIMETWKEAKGLRKDFTQLYWNEKEGKHPDFNDRFFVLNRRGGFDDFKREMYGHPPNPSQMTSVLRLYAIEIPSDNNQEPSAYIVTGGGIKLTDAMPDMKELRHEYNLMVSVQKWLELNKITNKQQLIEYQTNGN